jgi:hypothetical protein
MGALLGTFIKIALQVLAGVGIGSVLDKFAADKVPNYEPVAQDLTPGKVGFKPMKLVFTIVAIAIGSVVLVFIGKKMKIKILR